LPTYSTKECWFGFKKNKNGAKSLPLSTDHIEVYQAIPFDQDLGVTITVQETSEEKLVAKCTVYDEQGSVYLQMSGAAVTISKQLVW
jgi:acyl-CoA thioesterase FadM